MGVKNLKKIMEMRNIGNKELSEASGIPIGTLNKTIYGETKSPTLDNMQAIRMNGPLTRSKKSFDADGTVCARKITKKDAIQKCVRENQRRNEDGTFSGFADNTIHPFGKTAAGCEYGGEYELNGYIWE